MVRRHMGRPWRHHLGTTRVKLRRRCLGLLFLAGLAAGGLYLGAAGRPGGLGLHLELVRHEQEYRVELISQETADLPGSGDIYGVRFCPGSLEVQFYHSSQSVIAH